MNKPIRGFLAQATAVPAATMPDPSVLPDELLQMKRWLLWKYVQKAGQDKPAKVPYYLYGKPRSGKLDSPEDIARQATFTDVVATAGDPLNGYAGVGFAVTSGDSVGGIDLDNCLDENGDFSDAVTEEIYDQAKSSGCYCEVSPSGKGIRIIGKTVGFKSFNRGGFEAYSGERFLTITGGCRDNPKGFGSIDRAVTLMDQLVPNASGAGGLQRSSSVTANLSTGGYVKPDVVQQGGRNDAVLKHVGHLRGIGMLEDEIRDAARDFNTARCKPPLDDAEVVDIVGRYAMPQASPQNLQIGEWPDPKPVTAALAPVPPFDVNLLPDKFKPYVEDVADLMQTPPDFVAVSLMVAAAATLGNGWAIAPKAHDVSWMVPAVLWGAIVGRPGSMKSPAMKKALTPLWTIEQQLVAQHQQSLQQYKIAKLVYDAKYAAEKKLLAKNPSATVALPIEPDEPHAEHLLVNDATYEKLGEILRWSPRGVLVCMDELVGLLKGLDTQGQEKARAFYLSAWNSDQPYNFERIGRGSFTINRLSMCVLGGIQPDKLKEYTLHAATGGSGDDGLMQRFQLIVYPDPKTDWKNVDRPHNVHAHDDAMSVFQYLRDLDPTSVGARDDGSGGPAYLHFAPDAQLLFNQSRALIEKQVRSGKLEPALEAHYSKLPRTIASLALIIHLVDGGTGAVSNKATMKAIRWASFLITHAERVYAAATNSAAESAKSLAEKIKTGKVNSSFTVRTIQRKGWRNLTTQQTITTAVDILEEHEWLACEEKRDAGRPTQVYTINPKVTAKKLRS